MTTIHPGRHRPVSLPSEFVQRLSARGISRLVLPLGPHRAMAAGDLIWVREGITIHDRQLRRDQLTLNYAGEARRYSPAWPASLPKPPAGWRPAEAMPIQASRFTLEVEEVSHSRLFQVSMGDALSAGVLLDGDGYGCTGYPFMRPYQTSAAALQFLHQQMHPGDQPNPEVVVVSFRATTKNIALVVSEGAKWA